MSLSRSPICVLIACAVALLAGCQSNVERDVVEREMRQQEDQIYALQDYLSEYQQLLCNARAENAQLKRQMVQNQFREEKPTGGAPNQIESPSSASPATSPTPPPGVTEPEPTPTVAPEVPPLDFTPPSVPPLQDHSANEPEQITPVVRRASAEVEVVATPPAAVELRGEVLLDDEAGGPRVLVEVDPVAANGELTTFHGRLSLLVLDPAARAKEQQLARWDFEPAELAEMARDRKAGTSFEFPLQLPADAPTSRPLELWVRLVPEDGQKILGRTMMDLSRNGQFASAEITPRETARPAVKVAAAEMPVERTQRSSRRMFDTDVHSTGWEIAKPGDPAKPQFTSKSQSEWKLATGPVPESEPMPLVESKPVPAPLRPARSDDRYGTTKGPEWSPERPDGGAADLSQEPAWSPTP